VLFSDASFILLIFRLLNILVMIFLLLKNTLKYAWQDMIRRKLVGTFMRKFYKIGEGVLLNIHGGELFLLMYIKVMLILTKLYFIYNWTSLIIAVTSSTTANNSHLSVGQIIFHTTILSLHNSLINGYQLLFIAPSQGSQIMVSDQWKSVVN